MNGSGFCANGGAAGAAVGNIFVEPLLGGAGGGGGGGGTVAFVPGVSDGRNGGGGGAGGGALKVVAAGTLRIAPTGRLDARGGSGGQSLVNSAGGGGGAGGAIVVVAAVVDLQGSITAVGGGVQNSNVNGGTGGVGRIRVDAPLLLRNGAPVDAVSFSLSTTPAVGYLGDDDPDRDGLTNEEERALGTNRFLTDTDGDGIADGAEVAAGLNPLVKDASADPDGDGLTNAEEVQLGTDPFVNDATADFDGDGLDNVTEQALGTNVHDADTDHDGRLDGQEDANHNGRVDAGESDPLVADSDGDGILDGADALPLDPSNGAPVDLIVGSGQTVELAGRHIFNAIQIAQGGTVRGAGPRPLELISLSDITIAGSVDVSGGVGVNAIAQSVQGGLGGVGVAGGGQGGLGGGALNTGGAGSGLQPGQGGLVGCGLGTGGGGGGFGSPGVAATASAPTAGRPVRPWALSS